MLRGLEGLPAEGTNVVAATHSGGVCRDVVRGIEEQAQRIETYFAEKRVAFTMRIWWTTSWWVVGGGEEKTSLLRLNVAAETKTPRNVDIVTPAALPRLLQMSKRPADESLEVLELRRNAPLTPKRARVDEVDDETAVSAMLAANGAPPEVQAAGNGAEEDDIGHEESADTAVVRSAQNGPAEGFSDLYLDTVNRWALPQRAVAETVLMNLQGVT